MKYSSLKVAIIFYRKGTFSSRVKAIKGIYSKLLKYNPSKIPSRNLYFKKFLATINDLV